MSIVISSHRYADAMKQGALGNMSHMILKISNKFRSKAWCVILLVTFSWAVHAAERPNIIIIFVDDMTYGGIGYENPQVKTPHLNALAAQGLILKQAFAASPICAASRASGMTGLYPQQHGVISLDAGKFSTFKEKGDKAAQTLPNYLRQAGYYTAMYGKSHLGDPKSYGFEEGKEYKDVFDKETFTTCEAFLERAKDLGKPFFLWLSPRQPHVPLIPEQQWLDLYDENTLTPPENFLEKPLTESIYNQGKPGENYYRDSGYTKNWLKLPSGPPRSTDVIKKFTKAYYATISHLDSQIGHFKQRLDELALSDNTIIFFISDNGYHLGSHGLGNKITMHEESVHLPMFVTWPQGIKPAQQSAALVSSLDIFPTVLSLAVAAIPEQIMGKSLEPLFNDPTVAIRDVVFSECAGVGSKPGDGHRMARSQEWKYVLTDTNEEYLFDLTRDKTEQINVLKDPTQTHSVTAEHLRKAMAEWMKNINDRPFEPKKSAESTGQ